MRLLIANLLSVKSIRFSFSILLILLFLGLRPQAQVYAQTDCDCPISNDLKNTYSSNLSIGNKDSVEWVLQQLKESPNLYCQEFYLCWTAHYLIADNKLDSARIILSQSERAFEKNPCPKIQAIGLNALGMCYLRTADLDSAIITYLDELAIEKAINNRPLETATLLNLATIFSKLGQYGKSIVYYKEALPGAMELENKISKAKSLAVIAVGFVSNFEEFSHDTLLLDSGVSIAKLAIDLGKESGNIEAIVNGYAVLETREFIYKKYSGALFYANEGRKYLKNAFHTRQLTGYFVRVSDIFEKMGNLAEAEKYLDSAMVMNEITGIQLIQINLLEKKYTLSKLQGKWEPALIAYENMITLRDSIKSAEKFNSINELETKYQTEIKDAKIKDFSQQQEISTLRIRGLIFTVAAIILVLLLILFLYRQSTLRNRQKSIETELRLNRARMDPHFFFNALGSIQTLSIQEGSLKTAGFLAQFARIMRQTLESTYQDQITLESEVNFLTKYMDLQTMRFPQKFDYSISIDEQLDPTEISLPSMILQPFVENAIEHGFKSIEYPGKIDIEFKKNEKNLEIVVRDNGKFFQNAAKHKEYPSRATQIVRDRLFLLKKQTGKDAFFKIEQDSTVKGYKISLTLPLLYSRV